VVLPNERDPGNLDQRLTTVIRGDQYKTVGKWQRLEIGRPVTLMKQQQQLMQAQLKRPIDITGAYVDALLLNVYTGPGAAEVWIDDLEIGPVQELTSAIPVSLPKSAADATRPSDQLRSGAKTTLASFSGNQLFVGDKPSFFRGIRHTDTPLRVLRDAGFNTIFFDSNQGPKLVQEAAELGFRLVPVFKAVGDKDLATPEGAGKAMSQFSGSDLLFVHLGGTLAYEQVGNVAKVASLVRQADPGRGVTADVWDGLQPYSRTLQLVGVHRWPLATTLELPQYR